MSDIIPFPAPADTEARRRRVEEVRREREEQARLEASRLEDRRMLLERARKARAERKKMSALTERRSVARNLWEILDRLEKAPNPIRKVDVLIAAGKAQEGDSTKHLERYALRPGLPEVEEAKRSKRLVQAVRVYVEIARKAAELAGSDPDTAELEVLQGSRYLSDLPPERPDDPDARAADVIAEALRRMTHRLSERHNLKSYFEKCERHCLVPDSANYSWGEEKNRPINFIVQHGATLKRISLPHETWQGDARSYEEDAMRRCPAVHIGTVIAGPEFIAVATPTPSRETESDKLSNNISEEFDVRCIPVLEINLTLGPFGPGSSICAVLLLSFKTKFKPPADFLDEHPYFDGCDIFGDGDYTYGELGFVHGHYEHGEKFSSISQRARYVFENFQVIGAPLTSGTHRNFRETTRKRERIMLPTGQEQLLTYLLLPVFFRYAEDHLQSVIWSDQRFQFSSDDFVELLILQDEAPSPAATVSAEGTLLSRLERWMRGDLLSLTDAENKKPSLEQELEDSIRRLVEGCDAAVTEAKNLLGSLLTDAPDSHST